MEVIATAIPDVKIIRPEVHHDQRGFFLEAYNKKGFIESGLPPEFVQDNYSHSNKGVLRGLHYQIQHPQGKLVKVVHGSIFDAAVDLRRESPSFGRWVGTSLDSDSQDMLWVPAGFAHGFLCLSDTATVMYKTTDYYSPEWERTLIWNDPMIGIDWPLSPGQAPILSTSDKRGKKLEHAETYP